MTKAAVIAVIVGALFVGSLSARKNISGVAYFREVTTVESHNGAFPGSTQAWSTRVLLLHESKAIGTGGIACIYVTNTRRECFGTYVLPQGRIKVLGEITNRTNFQLIIVGGTGVYAGAQGIAVFAPGLVTFYLN